MENQATDEVVEDAHRRIYRIWQEGRLRDNEVIQLVGEEIYSVFLAQSMVDEEQDLAGDGSATASGE